MKLQEIKELVEDRLGIEDLSLKDRHGLNSMAKHAYYYMCRINGYNTIDSSKVLNQTHPTAVYHCNRHIILIDTDKFYRMIYYKVINAEDEKIIENNMNIIENEIHIRVRKYIKNLSLSLPNSVADKLCSLTPEQLQNFEETRLDPYLKML